MKLRILQDLECVLKFLWYQYPFILSVQILAKTLVNRCFALSAKHFVSYLRDDSNLWSSVQIKFPRFPPKCDEKINSISELVVSATFISLNYYNYCISLIYTRTRTMLGTHVAQLHTRNLYNWQSCIRFHTLLVAPIWYSRVLKAEKLIFDRIQLPSNHFQ